MNIGRWILEVQQGEKRAKYGKQAMKKLSESLAARFGRGFSVDNLENMRKFYITFKSRISETLFRIHCWKNQGMDRSVLSFYRPDRS